MVTFCILFWVILRNRTLSSIYTVILRDKVTLVHRLLAYVKCRTLIKKKTHWAKLVVYSENICSSNSSLK